MKQFLIEFNINEIESDDILENKFGPIYIN